MEKKKNRYRPDEIASIFNCSVRQVYYLIQKKFLARDNSAHCCVRGDSLRKFIRRFIPCDSFEFYTPKQISEIEMLDITPRTIRKLLNKGELDHIKINPDCKNTKSARIPIDTPRNIFRLQVYYKRGIGLLGLPPAPLSPKAMSKLLNCSIQKVYNMIDTGELSCRRLSKKTFRIV